MRDPIVPPTAEPVSLLEARIHLRQLGDGDSPASLGNSPAGWDPMPDDSWLRATISAARQMAEAFLGYSLTDAVYLAGFDSFRTACPQSQPTWWGSMPSYVAQGLQLPPGAVEVVSVQYLDNLNVLQTLAPSTYAVDPFNGLLFVDTPPALSTRPSPVRVAYRGEYGGTDSPARPVPEIVKHAILLLVGDWYENREDAVMDVRATTASAKNGFEALLRPLRVRLGMA